jgi:hypothetical protein
MAQHSHFHQPCGSVARTDPYSPQKQRRHCNSQAELEVGLCLEAGGSRLGCIPLGSVEVRIGHQVRRIAAVADTGWAPCQGVEGSQELAGSTLAQYRTLQALLEVGREHMVLDRKHLRKDRVLHFQLRLRKLERINSSGDGLTSACFLLSLSLFSFMFS